MLAGGAGFNLSNVDSSSKGKNHLTVGPVPVCSIIQNEQAHFFLWIKKKYVFTVLIRLQGQSNLQIKHQQKGKTIKIQINSIN